MHSLHAIQGAIVSMRPDFGLGRKMRIGDQGPAEADEVGLSVIEDLLGELGRIDAADDHHGDIEPAANRVAVARIATAFDRHAGNDHVGA